MWHFLSANRVAKKTLLIDLSDFFHKTTTNSHSCFIYMPQVPPGSDIHPFLKGNFAPVTDEYISHPCQFDGDLPDELLGGQYIRNGGNPVYPPEKGRHYHWCVNSQVLC